jgi:hypothetical protein
MNPRPTIQALIQSSLVCVRAVPGPRMLGTRGVFLRTYFGDESPSGNELPNIGFPLLDCCLVASS